MEINDVVVVAASWTSTLVQCGISVIQRKHITRDPKFAKTMTVTMTIIYLVHRTTILELH